jgi:nucleotide-binding universal stress UspA family protein
MYERILVPVDGSATAKRGLDEALKIAAKLGSTPTCRAMRSNWRRA